jgi:Tol biopolymer transport system component/DNA-binding winged helix-turn-helix (wHTH) protein
MDPVQTDSDAPPLTDPFRVGEWTADPMGNRIARGETVRKLEPKVMEVLACMATRPGETVTKDDFMAEVWTGTVVTDDVLARCISELRKALGDKARSPRYVETIRKRGYRLIAPVETEAEAPTAPTPGSAPARLADAAAGPARAAADGQPPGFTLRRPALPRRTRPAVLGWAILGAGVLAIGAVVAYQAGVAGVRPLAASPVTSYPGDERDPALSPDGERVAFAWDGGSTADGRQFDLYVQPTTGGVPVRLTMHPADERSPAWSPDARQVAFVRCGAGGECGVSVVPAEGGPDRVLVEPTDLAIEDLVWSPDGQTLAFSARQGRQGAYSLHLLSLAEGGPVQRLTAPASTYPGDLDPAFSPDGRHLAFVRTALDGRQDVAVVTVEGGRVRRLAREQRGITGLDWTADGEEVVYAANRDGAAGLWRVGFDGGDPRWVALGSDEGEIAGPSVARQGRGIAFARQMVRSQLVEVAPGDEAGRPVLASTRDDRQPAVAPGGDRVAFVSTRSGSHEVWVAAADGSGARQLTRFEGARVSAPQWSPDGGRLAVSARVEGNADVFVGLPDGTVRPVTEHPADDVAPTWSRDGEWIYFASDRGDAWQIYRVPAAGGRVEPVTVRGGVAAAEAPGGGLLVVRPDQRGLWRLPLGDDGLPRDAGARRLPANLSPADWANWAVAGDYVYVLERRYDGAATVTRLDPATGERTRVAAARDVPEDSGLAVFPDGQRFLLARRERADSDVVVVSDFE